MRRLALCALWGLMLAVCSAARGSDVIAIEGTLQTAPAYALVHVQVWDGDRALVGEAGALAALRGLEGLDDLDRLLASGGEKEHHFTAFLDTGASGHVISRATAARFGLAVNESATYHETGLHGEVAMGVSEPYALALSSSTGKLFDEPGQFGWAGRDVRFLINLAEPNPLVQLAMGEINVIGMPAIGKLVVEIDPSPMGELGQAGEEALDILGLDLLNHLDQVGVGPAVRLYDGAHEVGEYDVAIAVRLKNFARRHNPADAGPKPTLAENPVIDDVVIALGDRVSSGTWLLDTGAPASIISTKQAMAIGLYDAAGEPTRRADFALPLGGIGGQTTTVPGYQLDAVRLPTMDGRVLEYRRPFVLVKDISTQLDSGEVVTLDGVMGTNFFLPTVSGLGLGLPTDVAPGPYRRIWLDLPRGRLLLTR